MRWRRIIGAPFRLALGMFFTQSVLGAIGIVGWTHRLMRRVAYKTWWRQGRKAGEKLGFREWLEDQPEFRNERHWPNWIIGQDLGERIQEERSRGRRGIRAAGRGFLQSFGKNLRLGAQGIFNTSVLALPPSVLLLVAWYAGWQNSFNKGYEYAPIGPLTGLVGVFLWVAVLFYLPMAQARQAVTGDWRSFYQFGLVWRLVRQRWLSSVFLAGLYAAGSIPVTVLKTAPYFIAQERPEMADWPASEVWSYLNAYFFFSAALVFPLFVALRMAAARIYAGGIVRLLRTGDLRPDEPAANERLFLEKTVGLHPGPEKGRPGFVRFAGWTASRIARFGSGVLLFVLWFSFVAQIFVSEFLNYHPMIGWLNQPLVQLPFFRYMPFRVENFLAIQFAPVLFVVLAAAGIMILRRLWRSARMAWMGTAHEADAMIEASGSAGPRTSFDCRPEGSCSRSK